MRAALAALLLGALPAAAAAADAEAPSKDPAPLQTYYQEALDYYAKGDLRRAIGKWEEVLKVDSTQKTAKSMITQARRKIDVLTEKRRLRTFALIGEGRYNDARLEVQALLDQDPQHPQFDGIQTRLEEVTRIVKSLAPKDKAAHEAILGLKGYLVFPQDLRLAYDALRYAVELDGSDARFGPFLELVLDERPELREDTVTPGMKLIPYLQLVAVHQIYDGKYYKAVATLNEVLALEPDDVLALKRLGSAYYSLGEKKRARAVWEKAVKLQPGDKTLRKFLAKVGGPVPPDGRAAPSEEPAHAVEQP